MPSSRAIDTLNRANILVREATGRDVSHVHIFEDGDASDDSNFDPVTGRIRIDDDVLERGDHVLAAEVLAHEARHRDQWEELADLNNRWLRREISDADFNRESRRLERDADTGVADVARHVGEHEASDPRFVRHLREEASGWTVSESDIPLDERNHPPIDERAEHIVRPRHHAGDGGSVVLVS
jgi:hypothetical protein